MKQHAMVIALVLGILAFAAPLRAASVDGKWSGMLDTPNGAVTVGYTFKADGATLTGSSTGPDGMELAIKNGKVDGDKIAFTLDIDFGGMALTLNYTGVVSGDDIKMTMEIMGMAFDFTVKRVK